MPDDPGILTSIGIRVPAMFAGLAGGIVGAWADRTAGAAMWAGYIVCGGLTANFFAEPAQKVIPYVNEGGAGFVVGICALAIIKAVKEIVAKWQPQIGGKP
jgi:hypothetical protein